MAYTSPFDIPDDDPEFQAFKTQFLGTGKEQNGGLAGDLGTGLKIGVEQLPGIVTGLADIALSPVSKMTGVNRPVSRAADWLGEQTGFQPANWAKQAEQGYSPQYQEAKQNVHDAEGFLPTVGALARNPRFIAGTVAESIPSMVAGMGIAGVGARAVIGAEKLAALRAAAAAGDGAALTQLGRAGALAGGVGEGVVSAGQQMSQTGYDVDPLLAAGTATGAGIGTGAIGAMSGRLAAKMGISDVDSLAVTGLDNHGVTSGAKGIAKNMAKGVFTEGVLEELPQSMQEQIWQNVANGKPWDEGVSEQGAIGMMAGAVMGAGANIAPRSSPKPKSEPDAPVNLLSPDAPKGTQGDLFGEGGTQGPLMTPGYNDAPADGNPIQDRVVEMMSDRATLDAFVKENYTTNPDAAAQAIALIDRIDNGLRSITQGAPATDTYANFNPNQGSLDLGFAPDTAQEPVNLLAPESTQAPVQDDLVSRWEVALNETQSTQVAQESGQGASGVAGGSTGNTQTQPGVGRGGDNTTLAPVLGSGANQLVGNTTGPDGAGVNVAQPTQVATQTQKANDAKAGKKSGTTLAAQGVKPGTKGALEAAVTELMPEESTERQDHINAIQTAKSYTTARKALAKMSPQGLKIALRSAPQEEQRVVQTALGWDSQGNQVGSRIASYADVAEASGLNSRQRVQQILKSYGIDSDVINRMNAVNQQAVSVSELMPSQQEDGGAQDGTGFRIMDTPNASDDFVDDRKTRIETHLANKFAAEQGVTAKDLAQGVAATTEESPEVVRNRQEAARKSEMAMVEEARAIAGDLAEEAMSTWNEIAESASPQGPAFYTISPKDQVAWLLEYNEFIGEHGDEKFEEYWPKLVKLYDEYTSVTQVNNESGQIETARTAGFSSVESNDTGATRSVERLGVQSTNTGEQTQDASRAEQASSTEGSERVKTEDKWASDQATVTRLTDVIAEVATGDFSNAGELVSALQERANGLKEVTTALAMARREYPTALKDIKSAGALVKLIEQSGIKYSKGAERGPSNEEIDAFENGMLTLDEFLPERFPSVASREISFPGPGGRITPKAIPGYQFFRETNGEGLFDLLAYDKQYNFNRTFVATKPDIALGQGGNTGINVVFRSKSLSGRENVKPGTGKLAGREYVTEVIAPRAVVEVSMRPAQEKSLRPLVRRVLASEFDRTTDENGKLVFTRKLGYSRKNVAQQSRGVEGSTQASAIESKLKPLFFSSSRFSNRVVVVQSAAALPQNLQSSIDGNTQAFVQGGKVYMIADNIAEGKELAVFLHEVGVHLGMKGLIGQENLNRLAMQIKRWAVKNDGSVESELAKKALSRVKSAQQGGVDMELGDVIEERVAYFVEEAVNAGINPTALSKSGGPLQQWFRTLWAAVKVALRKFGLDRVHTLTAQNLVDLSYGAARLELEGTWHGTAADFRNFDHRYMGSGEGAQMFGWGTYLAQRTGIAKKYWEDDVGRKGGGSVRATELRERLETGVFDGGLYSDLQENYIGGRMTEQELREQIKVEEKKEGSLMRVDTAVHDDEMLDWDKPLSEQNKARIALMPVRKEIGGNLSELTDIPWNEMDGLNLIGNIYDRGVLVRALEEGYVLPKDAATEEALREGDAYRAASLYLDSIGIKGIKFLDSQSRHQPVVYDASKGYVTDASGSDITTTNGPKGAAHHYLIKAKGDYESALASVPTWDKHGRKELENMRDSGVAYAVAPKFYVDGVSEPFTTRESAENYIKSLDQTRNLVIFNDKNIQRVATQVGADRERIKFSKSTNIAQTNPQYRKTSTLVRQTLEYLGNKFQSVENNTMFGHQLAQKAEQLMPGTSRYFKSLIQRQTERVKHEQEIARIANRYNELETRDQNALNAFVQKSTMDGKWGFKPTWFEKDVQTPVDQTMKTEFDKLTPDAQQIAKDMFKFGSKQQKRFDTSVNANITDPKKKVQRNHMYGKPYAPLKRFGDHVVVGKSAEFVAEEKANPGSKRLEEMKADENHYYVEFTDGDREAIKRRDEMAATNPNMTWGSKPLQLENRALNSVNMTILEKLKNQIEASDNKSADATKGALKSLANQLYIQQLNQMHANKSQAKRLKVKGAEADMMKAFVSQGRAEAALIANLMTHAESEAGLQQIQTAARTGDNQDAKTRVANAVLRRHLAMLDFQPTPIQNKLMGANSFMMLLTSPAYYLTNATQPFVVSMPYMAGRFGGANSWNTLRDAYKTTLELVKLSTLFKDQNLDAAHLKKFNSVGREAEALQVLLDENLVNVGMEMELGDIASQSKNPAMKNLQKGLQVLKTGVASVEVLNRLSTAVAAYRLAYAEALNKGSSKDAAHEAGTSYARQTIIDTHGYYAGYNAPTVMMQGAFGSMPVKLMTQFKKFQFIQAGLLIGTFRDAYLRGNLNENEKAAAKAMFKWMLGTQAALAGALGGVTGVPMALLGAMMAGIFGDDGEDKEAFLRRILGGGAFAQLILHGAPAAAGVDISKRIGMGAALDPFRMADPQTDWSDYALSLAGPSAGLASRTASGLNYIGKGQYWKGLEMLMPSGILTNASKIARYEAEGLTNSRGDVVMKPEEISLMTDLMQGLGLETTQLSDRRWKAGAIYDRGIHFKEKTSQLQRQYVDAFKDGDREELTAIRQAWMKLQAERVNQGFKRENMTALTQAPMAQKKRERETVNGLQTTQTNKQFVASMDAL